MEPRGLEISPQNACDVLHAVAERHAWVATGLRVVGFASVVVATFLFVRWRDALLNYGSFFAVGFGAQFASRMRTYNAGAARQCIAAVERGSVARLVDGAIEVTLDVALTQRIELSSAAAVKLTAQLVPPARARLT